MIGSSDRRVGSFYYTMRGKAETNGRRWLVRRDHLFSGRSAIYIIMPSLFLPRVKIVRICMQPCYCAKFLENRTRAEQLYIPERVVYGEGIIFKAESGVIIQVIAEAVVKFCRG